MSESIRKKMGRRKRFNYAKYVKYDKVNNMSECLICKRRMKSLSTGNIKRHYVKLHKDNLDEELLATEVQVVPQLPNHQKIAINKSQFLNCCIGMVAVKSIPFNIFDDDIYFKKLIAPYENEFKTNLSSKNIQESLGAAVNEIRNIISNGVVNRKVSLKLDMIARGHKGVVGVNIQYIVNFKIVLRTIGIIEIHKHHNTKLVKSGIMECLSECGIENSQIYSTTIDDGTNVYLQEFEEFNEDDGDMERECEIINSSLTDVVKCAANALHFAAGVVIKNISESITECRIIVQTMQALCQKSESEMPILDNPSRWISTYFMIDSMLKMKSFVENLEDKIEIKWDFVTEFLAAFNPLVECYKKAIDVKYIIGDFFRDWLCCEIELEELSEGNIYASLLLKSFESRKKILLEVDTFLAALYIDPRFNFIKTPFLTDDQKQKALVHLMKTADNLKYTDQLNDSTNSRSSLGVSSVVSLSPFCKLEERTKSMIGSTAPNKARAISQKLENLRYAERLPFDADILNHWRSITQEDELMRQLSEVVLASPCSQFSTERILVELSPTLLRPKCKLYSKTLSNMLMIKLNSNIFRSIDLINVTEPIDEDGDDNVNKMT